MALSLFINESNEVFIIFEKKDKCFLCLSKNSDTQRLFLYSALEKYKRITLLKTAKKEVSLSHLNKHYVKHEDYVSIQKSYLKFLKEKISLHPSSPLSYEYIFNNLD